MKVCTYKHSPLHQMDVEIWGSRLVKRGMCTGESFMCHPCGGMSATRYYGFMYLCAFDMNTCIYTYVCMYVCMYVSVYIYIYIYMYIYMHTYTYMITHGINACMHALSLSFFYPLLAHEQNIPAQYCNLKKIRARLCATVGGAYPPGAAP
jgi:hypothetical protein